MAPIAYTVFLSAFLLFQVQPLVAKSILPWFGGSPAVWTTCMLFFQGLLLAGYAYAYGAVRWLGDKSQGRLHLGLIALALYFLPLRPDASWKPTDGSDPSLRILGLLGACVGAPYFLLSSTAPLLQAWYSRRSRGGSPYRLYALSNAGSASALLTYPVLFEPILTTSSQRNLWSAAFVLFGVLCAASALRAEASPPVSDAAEAGDGPAEPPGGATRFLWIALPACASILLLAVTNQICQEIAVIPFLWLLPLTLYLASFIVCFGADRWYRRAWWVWALVAGLGAMAFALALGVALSLRVAIALYATGLLVCCMVCHGELARLKPHPRHLTSFYLSVALGGALGGVFVALVAPRIFAGYFELHVGMVLCLALFLATVYCESPERFFEARWRWLGLIEFGVVLAMVLWVHRGWTVSRCHALGRNFYGTLRVKETGDDQGKVRSLVHGVTVHGVQFLEGERRRNPTSYYGSRSGIGLTLLHHRRERSQRVGVVGLGAGTLASYGRRGDYYRFYEINPLVVDYAKREFRYLSDSEAAIDIVVGDGRLSLEREQSGQFDVLALDAFSSDSVPVHLLTRQAFELYLRHLREDGVLVVHVTNTHLDLRPVVAGLARSAGREAVFVASEADAESMLFRADYVLVTSNREFLQDPSVRSAGVAAGEDHLRLWTDDYSNLFQILQ